MIFPANETSIYGWDFPWQTVSHNQRVIPFIYNFPIKTSIYNGFSMAMLNNHMEKSISHLSASPSSAERLASNPPPLPALRCTSPRNRRKRRKRIGAARQGANGCPGDGGGEPVKLYLHGL